VPHWQPLQGRTIGVGYQLFSLTRVNKMLGLVWEDLRPDPETITTIIKVATGGTVQFLIGSASWIFPDEDSLGIR
jgi:hypothetical protein